MSLVELQPFIDEITIKLPGWCWSLKIGARSAAVHIGADADGAYASVRKDGLGATRGGPGFDEPAVISQLFRLAIDAALQEKARCDHGAASASIHLLSYERRKRSE